MSKDHSDLLTALRADPWVGPGPIIRELRRGKGMRLKHLAEATGLSIGYISRLERNETGGNNPSVTNLELIARVLEIPLTTLLPPDVPPSADDLAANLLGREIMLALTYHQPTTIPMLERLCASAGTIEQIRATIDRLIVDGMIRQIPPSAPGRPIWLTLA